MTPYTNEYLRSLVRDDRVHRSIYTDPQIFELEMEKIFSRAWIYVGHESQIPNPGDFYCTWVARQPVVMTRDLDGKVHVLFNRCGHRGARVLNEECGNARVFTCMYHGWSFRPNGELSGVPMRRDFQEATLKDPQSGMARLPRMGNYRGFVFASLSPDVLPLLEYLGEARRGIDELVDRSPEGEIEFWAGCHRYEYNGNWKLQFENMADMYHPPACHASTVGPDGRQFSRRPGDRGGSAPFFADNGEPIVAQTGVRGFSNGHSSEASLFREEQAGGIWDDYRALMVKRYGEERTADILKNRRHSMALFPSVDILIAQTSVRVIRPISVDKTEVQVYPVRLKGAPPEISIDIVRFVNITHAAASLIQSDDLEAFERGQQGLTASGTDWVLVARGFGQEIDEGNGVLFGDRSSEVGQRAQHYAWRDSDERGLSRPTDNAGGAMSSARVVIKPESLVEPRLALADLQQFVEHEVALLDEQRFEEWLNLFADDGAYWVPANPGQESPFNHVSLFYDDKHTLTIRVQRLRHPAIHSQIPRSKTVRLVANFKLESHDADPSLYRVISKFVMLEDRPGYDRRLFGGRYTHVVRGKSGGLEIVLKRVDLTNCDQSFPALTQPF